MTDVAYYQRRLSEELAAIGRSNCPKAADAHRELAEIYRILIDEDGEETTTTAAEAQRGVTDRSVQDHVGTGII